MNLASLLPLKAVLPHVQARDKKQALKLLSAEAAALTGMPEREIFSVLMAREHLGCTAVGGGVAIPHGSFEGISSIFTLCARLDEPIDFGAADGRPVDLICMLLTPAKDNTEHLKALATVSRILRDKELCEQIRKAEDAKMMHRLLVSTSAEDYAAGSINHG